MGRLSPNALPAEPYNLLVVGLLIVGIVWAARTFRKLWAVFQLHRITSEGRIIFVDGLGHRLEVSCSQKDRSPSVLTSEVRFLSLYW
jgi:hypothetical protein